MLTLFALLGSCTKNDNEISETYKQETEKENPYKDRLQELDISLPMYGNPV